MSSLQKFHRRTQPFVVNTLHTGTVTITGTAAVGSVLTATNNIADTDGLGTFAYQWKRAGSAISGATGTTYTLVSADAGNTITATITYTDGNGFIETETSAATSAVIVPSPFTNIGTGNNTVGFYLGTAGDGTSKMIVAPKSTESGVLTWGSSGTIRGTNSTSDGLTNTNTLVGFGQAAHPAAYYAKSLSTGGYNTWYLPAKDELTSCKSNMQALPPSDNFSTTLAYCSSTELDATNNWYQTITTGTVSSSYLKTYGYTVRAVRRAA